jgi:hypothetical protein
MIAPLNKVVNTKALRLTDEAIANDKEAKGRMVEAHAEGPPEMNKPEAPPTISTVRAAKRWTSPRTRP